MLLSKELNYREYCPHLIITAEHCPHLIITAEYCPHLTIKTSAYQHVNVAFVVVFSSVSVMRHSQSQGGNGSDNFITACRSPQSC